MEQDLQKLIPFTLDDDNHILISAKELHQFLQIRTSFRVWFGRMIEYGFEENEDYKKVYINNDTVGGNQTVVDYMMKIDMAKEISMIQRSKRGKAVRKYFISVEQKFKVAQIAIKNLLEITNNNYQNLSDKSKSYTYSTKEKLLVTEKLDNVTSNLTTNFRDTAKIIGVRENLLVNWLLLNNYCYRDQKGNIKPYAKSMEFFSMREFTTSSGHSGTQTLINSKGREAFKNMLIDENVIKNSEMKLLELGEV